MTQPLAGKQILIVEDEPVFRSLMDSWLSSLGAKTLVAQDGVDALAQMALQKPDLMICDLAMPRMNGLQLVEHVRNAGEQIPILIISATENMAEAVLEFIVRWGFDEGSSLSDRIEEVLDLLTLIELGVELEIKKGEFDLSEHKHAALEIFGANQFFDHRVAQYFTALMMFGEEF